MANGNIDRMSLFTSLTERTPIKLGKHTIVVNEIQAEDGSGWSFIVSGQWVGYCKSIKLYVRIKGETATVRTVSEEPLFA